MDLSKDYMLTFLFVTILASSLFILLKLVTFIIKFILHIKNKSKYKNIIPSYEQQCVKVEQTLKKDGEKDDAK